MGTACASCRRAACLVLAVTFLLVGVPASGADRTAAAAAAIEPASAPWAGSAQGASPAAAGAGAAVRYEPPVRGPVRRPFDGPSTAFGAGHRGVDLAAEPGTAVRSAANGQVTFAGTVARKTWVSVSHRDGVVTTYGPLRAAAVRRGDTLAQGDVVGHLADGGHGVDDRDQGLHFSARRSGVYFDPMSLLDADRRRPSLVGPGGWSAAAHAVTPYEPWGGGNFGGLTVPSSPPATGPGFAVPPSPNHLVLVAGLATSSRSRVLDHTYLGYDTSSVTHFSYAGRAERAVLDPQDPRRDQLPYTAEDTWHGAGPAAARLADQLRAHAAREPGRPVDLVGHSMGGVVVLRYLVEHHDAYDRSLPPIGSVVLVASPLVGSDLAAVGDDLLSHSLLGPVAEFSRRTIADGDSRFAADAANLPLDAPAIAELRPGSAPLRDMAKDWEIALLRGPAGPLATGTRVLTIGGSRDRIVGADRSVLPGPADADPGAFKDPDWVDAARTAHRENWDALSSAPLEHRVLPGGHTAVLETEAFHEMVYRFLAGEDIADSDGRLATQVAHELGTAARLSSGWLRIKDVVATPIRALLRRPTPTIPDR